VSVRAAAFGRFSPYGRDLPPEFWFLWLGTLVNRLGGFVVPFLMLYLTSRLQIEPATAALMVSVLGAGSFISQLTGGELADRIGRRPVMLFSFFASSAAMLALGFLTDPVLLVVAMFALGVFADLSRPAISAAVVDLVPAEKRTRAFGYIYWAINLGAALAPIVAGLMANVNFFLLFVADAATTAIFGVIVLLRIVETRPARGTDSTHGSSLAGRAGRVAREPLMLVFALLALVFGIVYAQSHVTLPLSMADDGLPPSDYGLAIAVNGALIVLITLRAVKIVERWPRFPALAVAALLLGTGFGLTGWVDTLPLYAFTVVIWTLGEIIGAAIAPVVVSELSPVDMRGLYQGIFGSMWGLAFFIGPVVGGWIYQELGSQALWGTVFIVGIVLAAAYLLVGIPARRRLHRVDPDPVPEAAG
jgi:MFS family permease